MNCRTQKEVLGVLDQLRSNPLYYTSSVYTYNDGFRKDVLELYGVQYIGRNGNGYEYEAIVFEEYKCNTSDVMFVSNALTEDVVLYEEVPIKQISDTCIRFILSQYYDPSIYNFSIDDYAFRIR